MGRALLQEGAALGFPALVRQGVARAGILKCKIKISLVRVPITLLRAGRIARLEVLVEARCRADRVITSM
jgi:hypothetical protein